MGLQKNHTEKGKEPFLVPVMYPYYVISLIKNLPTMNKQQKKEWKDAMIEEYQLSMKNDVWNIVPRPEGKSVVNSKWIYKIKNATDGSIEKYKAIFLAHGFSQKEGIDYEETFALVARYTSIDQHLLWLYI